MKKRVVLFLCVLLLGYVGIYLPYKRYLSPSSDIPKIIHYCWFGGAELPDYAGLALSSWEISNPDFRIQRWDENNFDVTRTPFLKKAYENKNYAYVADVCRLEALKEYGGLYLDVDHVLLKDIRPFLIGNLVLTFERQEHISGSFMAAVPKHPFISALAAYYDDLKDVADIPITDVLWAFLIKMYPNVQNVNQFQKIEDSVLWPTNMLMINLGGGENAAVHLYANTGTNHENSIFGYWYNVFLSSFLSEATKRITHPDKEEVDFLIDVPRDYQAYFFSDKQSVIVLRQSENFLFLLNIRHGFMIYHREGELWKRLSLWDWMKQLF